jgi:hypothetical protein
MEECRHTYIHTHSMSTHGDVQNKTEEKEGWDVVVLYIKTGLV